MFQFLSATVSHSDLPVRVVVVVVVEKMECMHTLYQVCLGKSTDL
jgi:hypothetical protein